MLAFAQEGIVMKNMRFVFVLLMMVFPLSLHAEPENNLKSLPDVTFKGELKTFRGHELGYMRPQEGDTFELDFTKLEEIEGSLGFVEMRYIPLPAKFEIQGVESYDASVDGWSNFRAVSSNGTHKVTLDVQRKPGSGDKDFSEMWVLIESRDRITGVLEIHGKIYPNN